MEPPLILLDVDGVLNPARRSSPRLRRHTCVLDGEPQRVLLDRRHGAKLLALARETGAELVWATRWEEQANTEIGPRVGLPDLPVVAVAGAPSLLTGENVKTRPVAAYARRRPFVWFDDHLTAADEDYLRGHPEVGDFLLVGVDPRTGLTDGQLARARSWLTAAAARRDRSPQGSAV
ncbi:HAD domain-containing protein [Planomonospora alba]|uniref:HAD domain-containing protein n=1 Tax=Planomonospora alba TaxID=161354 RepID=A0ABP6NMH0_9ACTN